MKRGESERRMPMHEKSCGCCCCWCCWCCCWCNCHSNLSATLIAPSFNCENVTHSSLLSPTMASSSGRSSAAAASKCDKDEGSVVVSSVCSKTEVMAGAAVAHAQVALASFAPAAMSLNRAIVQVYIRTAPLTKARPTAPANESYRRYD